MGAAAVGDVALVPFPFSDLSAAKLRPAIVVAQAEHGDVILCQVTSRPYASTIALPLGDPDFTSGGLHRASFARPDKLFTASPAIIRRTVGKLTPERMRELRQTIAQLFAP